MNRYEIDETRMEIWINGKDNELNYYLEDWTLRNKVEDKLFTVRIYDVEFNWGGTSGSMDMGEFLAGAWNSGIDLNIFADFLEERVSQFISLRYPIFEKIS